MVHVAGVIVLAVKLVALGIVYVPPHQSLYLVLESAQRWVNKYPHPNYQVHVVVVEVLRNQVMEQQNVTVEE